MGNVIECDLEWCTINGRIDKTCRRSYFKFVDINREHDRHTNWAFTNCDTRIIDKSE